VDFFFNGVGIVDWTNAKSLTAMNGSLFVIQNNHLHRIAPSTGS